MQYCLTSAGSDANYIARFSDILIIFEGIMRPLTPLLRDER
jgi:hypothetical protein